MKTVVSSFSFQYKNLTSSFVNTMSQQAFTEGIHKTNLILRARFPSLCPLYAATNTRQDDQQHAQNSDQLRDSLDNTRVKRQTQAKRQKKTSWHTSWETSPGRRTQQSRQGGHIKKALRTPTVNCLVEKYYLIIYITYSLEK